MSRISLFCLSLLGSVGSARAHDFVDSRLTVTFGDEDFLSNGDEDPDRAPSMLPGFGDRSGYELFYDNLNRRHPGRETLTHLVFYREMPAFFRRLTTAAAVAMQLELAGNGVALSDTGSYARLFYAFDLSGDGGIELVAFPFNAERVRLGFLYDLSIAGNELISSQFRLFATAPGARLRLKLTRSELFIAFKTSPAMVVSEQDVGADYADMQYMVLGGASWSARGLRLDLEAGFFEQGNNPTSDVRGEAIKLVGAAARVSYGENMELEESIDTSLYRNDPNRPFIAFAPVRYRPGELGYLLAAEWTLYSQRLADPDRFGKTTQQVGYAGAMQARVQRGYWRLQLTGLLRSLAFVTLGRGGMTPFVALSDDTDTTPEVFVSAATDLHIPVWHLTLGFSAGLRWLATASTTFGSSSSSLSRKYTVLVSATSETILPDGEDALPVFGSRVQARIDLSEMFYVIAWIQYEHDPNFTFVEVDPEDSSQKRVHGRSDRFGGGISAAVRL